MLQLSVDKIKGGEVLLKDIMLEDYSIVLARGTVLQLDHVSRLKELRVRYVYIAEDKKPNSEQIIIKNEINTTMKSKVQSVFEKHIYKQNKELTELSVATENIITDIMKNDDVVENVYEIKERSNDLYEHSVSICSLAILVGLKLKLPEETVQQIGEGCLMHDIGLRYLSFNYNNEKLEELNHKDKAEMKKHPIYGYTILRSEEWVATVTKNVVLYHHECLDSSGYPLGASEIPYEAQLVNIVDVFDEMISGIGTDVASVNEAIEYLKIHRGTKFNPEIVDTFLQLIAAYPSGTKVKTSEGEIGIVIGQNKSFPDRPIIRIENDKNGKKLVTPIVKDLTVYNSVFIKEVKVDEGDKK